MDAFSPHSFVSQDTSLQTQVEACRSIKPGMTVAQVEADLRECGFTCLHAVDASGNPYLDACASGDGVLARFYLVLHAYYQDGVITHREAKGRWEWEQEGLTDSTVPSETFDINLDNHTTSIFVPTLVKEPR
jgi:hypothetical protein